jgi:hypothetical protein
LISNDFNLTKFPFSTCEHTVKTAGMFYQKKCLCIIGGEFT